MRRERWARPTLVALSAELQNMFILGSIPNGANPMVEWCCCFSGAIDCVVSIRISFRAQEYGSVDAAWRTEKEHSRI